MLLLRNIAEERNGQLIDRSLMKTTLSMLSDCSGAGGPNVYEEDFERPFLEETRQFYRVESQDFISRNTCPDFMRKVRACYNKLYESRLECCLVPMSLARDSRECAKAPL